MLDVEKVMTILQSEVNKREKAKSKWFKYHCNGNKNHEDLYCKRYYMYCSRFDGMCDILFDLGYLAWANEYGQVFVEKRVDDDVTTLVDEIPF